MAKKNEKTITLQEKVKEMKKDAPRAGITAEGKKSRALKALTGAMEKRGWEEKEQGIYELSGVCVNTNQQKPEVIIDNKYVLNLGKGAIKELDAYMRLK